MHEELLREVKENDGGRWTQPWCTVITFVNVTMYPQYNLRKKGTKKKNKFNFKSKLHLHSTSPKSDQQSSRKQTAGHQ
jgi:hypothetical protein